MVFLQLLQQLHWTRFQKENTTLVIPHFLCFSRVVTTFIESLLQGIMVEVITDTKKSGINLDVTTPMAATLGNPLYSFSIILVKSRSVLLSQDLLLHISGGCFLVLTSI